MKIETTPPGAAVRRALGWVIAAGAVLGASSAGTSAPKVEPVLAKPAAARPAVSGWLNWRGPNQNGTSAETGLPGTWKLGGANDLWSVKLSGGGAPVVANGRLYTMGYEGTGPDLQEVLLCADAETGKKLWEKRFSDFLSDVVYDRYAIGAPAIDPLSGNVFAISAAGVFSCFTPAGKLVWQRALMEELGRLTFPNGRNGSVVFDDDLVIMHGITSNWGAEGPASDRYYAFNKDTGALVWSSTPGVQPKDNSFCRPILAWRNGKRVMYVGTGCGHIAAINVRTGQPLWRFPLSAGGINSSVLLYKNLAIGMHADENLDNSEIGRQTAVDVNAEGTAAPAGAPILPATAEVWRNRMESISSSPVLVGNRIYATVKTGQLAAIDADTGKVLWEHKLAPDQLHASPTYADGKLYVPMQNGSFYIIQPGPKGCQELAKVQLAGRCLGAPAVWNGKIYVHTTERLYCFGKKGPGKPPASTVERRPAPGAPIALQVIPAEVRLRPGGTAKFTIRSIDANGIPVAPVSPSLVQWAKFIPPTARVRSEMNGSFDSQGQLIASPEPKASAGAWEASFRGLKGYIRGRVMPAPPMTEDFEGFNLDQQHAIETDVKFAYPPLTWIGARFKWEVREREGNKVLAKALDNIFFQRATVFLSHPDNSNYTLEADVLADGNRRTKPIVGLINQHYLITLVGNNQELEVSSNVERIKVSVPFAWTMGTWYHMKTRVDVAPDGSGVVRARVWKKGDPEPSAWTIEVPHKKAHTYGSPGIFGFSPQSLFRTYVDNIRVTPN